MKVVLMPMALPGTTDDDDVWSTETLTWIVDEGTEVEVEVEVEVGGLSEVLLSWTMSCCNSASTTLSDLLWCSGWSLQYEMKRVESG